jgi:Capsular polysaccharide synthesis protein
MNASWPVWLYWETPAARRRSAYIDLCLETIRLHAAGVDIRVLDASTVFDWLRLDRRAWMRLPDAARRADYVRTRLVHTYGGLWLDSDLVALRPITEILDKLNKHETVGWGREHGIFSNCLFASRAGSAFLGEWIIEQDRLLHGDDWQGLWWTALGQDIAWPLAQKHAPGWIPAVRIAPVYWPAWPKLLSPFASPERVLVASPITVMLFNRPMHHALGELSREELLHSRMLVSRLLRIGLGVSSLEDELDGYTRLHSLADVRHSHFARRIRFALRRGRHIIRWPHEAR